MHPLMNHHVFGDAYEGADYKRAVAAAGRLGYLFVSSVRIAETAPAR